MKINLDIREDSELRAFVKDLIKGQVRSVAREEIRAIIKEVFLEKSGRPLENIDINAVIRNEAKEMVREVLGEGSSWGSDNAIKIITRDEVNKYIKELFSKGAV